MTHPCYDVWKDMIGRCHNPAHPLYAEFGGRGIRVCKQWFGIEGFQRFNADMGERIEEYRIVRRDEGGDFTPENCKWAEPSEEALRLRRQLQAQKNFRYKNAKGRSS